MYRSHFEWVGNGEKNGRNVRYPIINLFIYDKETNEIDADGSFRLGNCQRGQNRLKIFLTEQAHRDSQTRTDSSHRFVFRTTNRLVHVSSILHQQNYTRAARRTRCEFHAKVNKL